MHNTYHQHIFLDLELFERLTAVKRILVHHKFHRLSLSVCNRVHGQRCPCLVLHRAHILYNIITAQLFGADNTAQRQRIQYGIIFQTAKFCDDLRNFTTAAIQRDNNIHLIHPGERHQGVTVRNSLIVEQKLFRGIPMNDGRFGKHICKLDALVVILLDNLDANTIF